MYSQISNLVSALDKCGALSQASVRAAIEDFAACLEDEDYRTHMLGELALRLAEARNFEEAEGIVRRLLGLEKSSFLTKVADIEARVGRSDRATSLYDDAASAALEQRFPAQQSQAIAAVAQSVERYGKWDTAANFWHKAVELAQSAQSKGGTDGPEAAGVLLEAVEAFCSHGDRASAEKIARSINIEDLRHRALEKVSHS